MNRFAVFLYLLAAILHLTGRAGQAGSRKKPNRPDEPKPKPVIIVSRTQVSLGQIVTFDATRSLPSRPKGKKNKIILATWNFGDGTTANGLQTNHEYTVEGTYFVSLTVVDHSGRSASSAQPTTITVVNNPPKVEIVGPQKVTSQTDVQFQASVSDDGPTASITYQWQFGDGESSLEKSPIHVYARPNQYAVILTVTDAFHKSSQAQLTIEVANQLPKGELIIQSDETDAHPLQTLKEICLNGFGSRDPDGEIKRFDWTIVHLGTRSTQTIEAGPAKLCHQFPVPGRYEITLAVTDDLNATSSISQTVNIENRRPIAQFDIGSSNSLTLTEVMLDGSRSYDLDGNVVKGQWDFGDGSEPVIGLSATHTYVRLGIYQVTLTVFDDIGDSASITNSIVIGNRSPIVTIEASPLVTQTRTDVTVDITNSFDPDGSIASYSIDFGDQPLLSDRKKSIHQYPKAGVYTVFVRVTDDKGATATETAIVTITNRPPTVTFTANWSSAPNNPYTFETITLAAQGTDEDGSIIRWDWDLGDGSKATGKEITYSYHKKGRYVVKLSATDDSGATVLVTWQLTVQNQAPIFSFTQEEQRISSGESITFDASLAKDNDGTITEYRWQTSDGRMTAGKTATFSFLSPGTHIVMLELIDDDGGVTTRTFRVVTANRPPVANFTFSPASPLSKTLVTFQDLSTDPDTSISNREWKFPDGTIQLGSTVSYTFQKSGVQSVTLAVTDSYDGTTASKTQTVMVGNRPPMAKIVADPLIVEVGKPVAFSASGSTDDDGDIAEIVIEPGDEARYTASVITHTYTTAGSKTAKVTVKDNLGDTGTATVTVTVTNPPPPPRWPPADGGGTDTPYLGNSKVFTVVSPLNIDWIASNLALWKKVMNGTEQWYLWATPPTSLYRIPDGLRVFNYNTGTYSIVVDHDGNAWTIGRDGLGKETLDRITPQQNRDSMVSNVSSGFVLGVDRDKFLYFSSMDSGRTYVYVFDLTTNDLLRNNNQPVRWELPYAPRGATIANGTELWITHLLNGPTTKIVHYNRVNGIPIKEISISQSEFRNIAVGPANELVLTYHRVPNQIIALRPDTAEVLWSWAPPLGNDESFTVYGLSYLDGAIATSGVIEKISANLVMSTPRIYLAHF